MHVFLLEFALYLHGKAIFTLVKDVRGRLAERVESVDQNETEHMSERQKKNLLLYSFTIFITFISYCYRLHK